MKQITSKKLLCTPSLTLFKKRTLSSLTWVLILGLALVGCSTTKQQTSRSLQKQFDSFWHYSQKRNPTWATIQGNKKYNDKLVSPSKELYEQDLAFYQSLRSTVQSLDDQYLSSLELANKNHFLTMLDYYIKTIELKSFYILYGSRGGFHTWFAMLPEYTPFTEVKDYHDYLTRLEQTPEFFQSHIKMSREALKLGYNYPKKTFQGFDQGILLLIKKNPIDSVFFKPFQKKPSFVTDQQWQKLRTRALDVISVKVTPSYEKFYSFWQKEVTPNMRTKVSVYEFPLGKELYHLSIKRHTSLDLSAKDIHQIGLKEVKRIRGEMKALTQKIGFKGNLKQFIKKLRTDPKFYPKTKQELLSLVNSNLRKMDKVLPSYFLTLPKAPYVVKEIPSYKAHKETTAYYMRPSKKANRPGTYFVNTSQLKQRPLYEVEALSFHEAVPGHHLQIAIEQELENIPRFRKNYGSTAFVEGWGLYSESLAKEMGFYQDPYSDFGRLTYEIWRACRLVVDTGLHAFGWSRTKAINYMLGNTALSRKNIEVEVDRYITTPAQALAYKLGELKIQELKRKAKNQLQDKFDIRAFHDTVLKNGSVPLNVLEAQVESWIKSQTL